jgi:hypothetical protein
VRLLTRKKQPITSDQVEQKHPDIEDCLRQTLNRNELSKARRRIGAVDPESLAQEIAESVRKDKENRRQEIEQAIQAGLESELDAFRNKIKSLLKLALAMGEQKEEQVADLSATIAVLEANLAEEKESKRREMRAKDKEIASLTYKNKMLRKKLLHKARRAAPCS